MRIFSWKSSSQSVKNSFSTVLSVNQPLNVPIPKLPILNGCFFQQQSFKLLEKPFCEGLESARSFKLLRQVCLRSDNGPEPVSHVVQNWLEDKYVGTHYIEPGSPR